MPHRAKQTHRRWRLWLKWCGYVLGGLIVVMGIVGVYYWPKAKRVLADARRIEQTAKDLSHQISQQQFAAAKRTSQSLPGQITMARDDLHLMAGLSRWPYIGRQYQAADALLVVAQDASQAASPLVDFLNHVFEPFAGRGKISLASITPAEKGLLLAGIAGREDSLRQAQSAIAQAAIDFQAVPTAGLIGQLRRVVSPLKTQLPAITQALNQAIPATHILPPLLGYPQSKTYLFLLENNTELRPGGGFIGTYGLMKVASGEIVSLKTDNSYNLDAAAKHLKVVSPPAPLQKYLKANAWYFRDANWSPDFPTSAQQALTLYQREGGSKNVDGVLAVTPTLISSLLRLVGPIKVGSATFTADNFTDKLQYYVDQGYAYAGQDLSQRKDIIGTLTAVLMNRLLSLPVVQWKDLFLLLSQQLEDKQLLFFMNDNSTQSQLEKLNWAGALQPADGADYLLVADANLASLKTDPAVFRTYTYDLQVTAGQAEATLTIEYDHRGKFDWKTTRYNTYVRVYVPAGSTLIDSHGAQLREKSAKAGTVSTTSELGLTVFGAYKSVEPKTRSELVLHYRLPTTAAQQLAAGQYRLHVQKEAGLTQARFNLNLSTPQRTPHSTEGLDNLAVVSHDGLRFSGALDHDRMITITY